MQNTFKEYPKALIHPGYKAAVVVKWDHRLQPHEQKQGSPAKFPPVEVHNKDQELQYASLGYRPSGVADEAAYMRSVLGADAPPEYTNVDYPAYRYRVVDGELKAEVVNNEAEDKKLGKHWHKLPDHARAAEYDDESETEVSAPASTAAVSATGKGSGKKGGRPPKVKAQAVASPT